MVSLRQPVQFVIPDRSDQVLPGPDRRRRPAQYRYHLSFQSERPATTGCVALWIVEGGRMPYQIALERDEAGRLHWHCTCADAVFRAENEHRHCKHVRGLLASDVTASTNPAALPPVPESR
jgi:hypothetical protein